jgi:DNA primase
MGRIPQAFIDEVLERTAIESVIDAHVPLKKRGNNYIACCPFHSEKTPSFNVAADKGFYHCFGCGVSGNAISFLMDYLKQDFLEALENLAEAQGLELPKDSSPINTAVKTSKSLYSLMDKVCHFYQQQLKKNQGAIDYLKQRGLSGDTVAHFRIGFAPAGWQNLAQAFAEETQKLLDVGMLIQNDKGRIYDRYRDRVMFPIFNAKGFIVGFGGRVLDNSEPKYLNSPETVLFNKSREVYGLYQVKMLGVDSLVVTEGYMDVVSLYQGGIKNAVATLGTATTTNHLQMLLKVSKDIVFCFDGDKAGRAAAWRALIHCMPLLDEGINFRFIMLSEGDDPDSLVQKEGREGVFALVAKSEPIVEFFVANVRAGVDLSKSSGRSLLMNKASDVIKTLKPSAYREIIFDKLSQLARLDKESLKQQFLSADEPIIKRPTTRASRPSAMRLALALLIQNPGLYQKLEKPLEPSILSEEGAPILKELLFILEKKTNTAQVIEHWRDREDAPIIKRLSTLMLQVPKEGMLDELKGALMQLHKNALKQQVEKLLQKSALEGLSDTERETLQRLIRQTKESPQSY